MVAESHQARRKAGVGSLFSGVGCSASPGSDSRISRWNMPDLEHVCGFCSLFASVLCYCRQLFLFSCYSLFFVVNYSCFRPIVCVAIRAEPGLLDLFFTLSRSFWMLNLPSKTLKTLFYLTELGTPQTQLGTSFPAVTACLATPPWHILPLIL